MVNTLIGKYQTEQEIADSHLQASTRLRTILPGDWIYEDYNPNNRLDGGDARPLFYDDNPKMNYGLTLGASYKGFDINVLFQGAALFSKTLDLSYKIMGYGGGNFPAYFLDRWHKADPYDPDSEWIPGEWPAMRGTVEAGMLYLDNDIWRRDCSYLRLKNVAIGYTVPVQYIQKAGLSSCRIFFDANNLYTWCGSFVKLFDPEKNAGANNSSMNYPIMRTYNIGLNISF